MPASFRATAASVAPDLATRLNEIIRLECIILICKDLPTLEQLDDGLAYLHLLRFCLIPRLSAALQYGVLSL